MNTNEKDRVVSFKRILGEQEISKKLIELKDEDFLILLNSAILPNSISNDNLKYTLLMNYVFSKGKKGVDSIDSNSKNIKELYSILGKTEKDLLKYGYFYGFRYYSWEYVLNGFIRMSTDPSKGKLLKQKIVSSVVFRKIFPFIYQLIKKGEKNDRFPRL